MLVVHSGCLVERLIHRGGDELIVAFLGRGKAAGLAELFLGAPSERETVAGSDATLLSIPWPAVAALAGLEANYWSRVNRELARECAALLDKLVALSFAPLEARIAGFLLEMDGMTSGRPPLRVTQGTIAKAVAASRPKVNLCLKRLERAGLIVRRGCGLPEVRNRPGLRRLL